MPLFILTTINCGFKFVSICKVNSCFLYLVIVAKCFLCTLIMVVIRKLNYKVEAV